MVWVANETNYKEKRMKSNLLITTDGLKQTLKSLLGIMSFPSHQENNFAAIVMVSDRKRPDERIRHAITNVCPHWFGTNASASLRSCQTGEAEFLDDYHWITAEDDFWFFDLSPKTL